MTKEKFFWDNYARLRGTARRLARNREDAEDLMVESYIKFQRANVDLDIHEKVYMYFVYIMRSVAVDAARKRKLRFIEINESQNTCRLPEPYTEDVYFDYVPDIFNIIENPVHRRIAELRLVHDLSQREISEIMGVPEGTVKSTVHRATLKLRQSGLI